MEASSNLHDVAGSVTAGCSSTLVGHPLDTIKVYQQTQPHLSKASSLHVAKILARDNVFGLFRGIGPPMANQIVMNTVMFSVFHNVKAVLTVNAMDDNAEGSLISLNENTSAMCAGLLSGFATACLSTPTDWVKIQAQLQQSSSTRSGNANAGTLSILKQLLRDSQYRTSEVTRTLYRGHVANLAREGVFTMVYLGLYDRICASMIHNGYGYGNQQGKLHMGQVMMVSSFTGACAWICNYPFDTIKTVMQGKGERRIGSSSASASASAVTTNVGSAIQSIWKSGGFKAFFRGVHVSTFRAMLVTSIRMLAYEKTKQLLENQSIW